MRRVIFLIPLFLLAAINIRAQSIGPGTLNATGGAAVISGNEYEWSIGEMTMVSTFSSASIVVTQGVLQISDSAYTGVPIKPTPSRHLQVFPNPASTVVNLQLTSPTQGTLSYTITDMTGKVLGKHSLDIQPGTTTEQVDIKEFACATYLLNVSVSSDNSTPERFAYRIQKIK